MPHVLGEHTDRGRRTMTSGLRIPAKGVAALLPAEVEEVLGSPSSTYRQNSDAWNL